MTPMPFTAPRYLLDSYELRVLHNTEEAHLLSRLLAGMDPWHTLRYTADALEGYLLHADAALSRYAVVSQDTIIGVICIRYPWLRGAYVELIGLDPVYQGVGIGSALLHWIEEQAQIETQNVWVLTSTFNTRARTFYARHGYVEIGILNDFVQPGYHEVLLRKVVR
jgi:GNAT superfamily N-acetyltransferase